jgi:hypothetical protein
MRPHKLGETQGLLFASKSSIAGYQKKKHDIIVAIPGRASAEFCKQGKKQPFVLFNIQVKGRHAAGRCMRIQLK